MAWNKKKDVFALMVGHGTQVNGAWDSGCAYGKYTEAALMLPIVKYAVKWLRKSGVKVLTDADKNNNRNMISCVKWANEKKCKFYMSVHCDYKEATKGVYPQYVSSKGKAMGNKIGKYCAKYMNMTYNGVNKRKDLYELNATNMPSVVFETGAIKADLAKLKNAKAYGKILAKAICRYIGVPFYVSNRIKLARKTAAMVVYMNKHHFKYERSYKKCASNWKGAKKLKRCNCHLLINYAMQECGFLDKNKGQRFWGNGTKLVCKGKGTKKQLLKVAKITHPKKSPAKCNLKKGYVVCYGNGAHTQEYAKLNKDKKPQWFSWGGSDVGKAQPRRKKKYDTKKISTLIVLK